MASGRGRVTNDDRLPRELPSTLDAGRPDGGGNSVGVPAVGDRAPPVAFEEDDTGRIAPREASSAKPDESHVRNGSTDVKPGVDSRSLSKAVSGDSIVQPQAADNRYSPSGSAVIAVDSADGIGTKRCAEARRPGDDTAVENSASGGTIVLKSDAAVQVRAAADDAECAPAPGIVSATESDRRGSSHDPQPRTSDCGVQVEAVERRQTSGAGIQCNVDSMDIGDAVPRSASSPRSPREEQQKREDEV